ncbi:MAG: aminotransferase class V-fold PLP-dependent enzyme, partial [Chitinophagaceae bacterium]
MVTKPVYLDYNATTPLDPRVLDAMMPFMKTRFGNAASRSHLFGREAADAVEDARNQVARLIGAEPQEIIFTSGATESINLALKGAFEMYRSRGNHIITVATEHKAVLDTCARLEEMGAEVTYLSVNAQGSINMTELEKAFRPTTILVSVMFANNETGV